MPGEQPDEVDVTPAEVRRQRDQPAPSPHQGRYGDARSRQLDVGRQLADHLFGEAAQAASHDARIARPVVSGQTGLPQRRPVEGGHPHREVVDLDLEPEPGHTAAVGCQ